jgi:hypothetical protein
MIGKAAPAVVTDEYGAREFSVRGRDEKRGTASLL